MLFVNIGKMVLIIFSGLHVHLWHPWHHPRDVLHLPVGHLVDVGEAVRDQVQGVGLSGK